MPRIPDNVLNRAWQTDPYVSDPHSIIAVVSHFFAQVEDTMIMRFLPQEATMAWISTSAHRKTPEDLMLLYSMLAIGVALSNGPRHIAFEYAQVAHYAQKTLQLDCIQLVQCRIILALYYVATNRPRDAIDLLATAAAASASLQLHVEIEDSFEAQRPTYPLNLTRAGFSEARRRTMWSLFMLERLSGVFPHQPAIINAEDICIRLPIESQSFEKQIEETAPLFDPYEPAGPTLGNRSLDVSGYLIEMIHIWSSCQSVLLRAMRRTSVAENEALKMRSFGERLVKWRASLPDSMAFNSHNLESAMMSGKSSAFGSMHLLHRHACIEIARFGRVTQQMSDQELTAAMDECRGHAMAIIEVLRAMEQVQRRVGAPWSLIPPTAALIVSEAVDILSCAGPLSELDHIIESISSSRSALNSMVVSWDNQRAAVAMVDDKLVMLRAVRERGANSQSPTNAYRIVRGSPEESGAVPQWQLAEGLRNTIKGRDVFCSAT